MLDSKYINTICPYLNNNNKGTYLYRMTISVMKTAINTGPV